MKKYKVAIVGCGQICRVRHAPEYAENPSTELIGFYDMNLDRAKELAAQYHCQAFDSLDALLAAKPDLVSVCSANTDHARSAIAALEHGCDVLCEKPMAVTLADCEAMLAAAQRTGKRLLIGHNQRLAPAHQEARRLIKEGAIGKVLTFHTTFGHGGPESWTGVKDPWFFHRGAAVLGAAADLGIHKIDLINYLTDDPIIIGEAKLLTLDKKLPDGSPIQVDDNAIFLLRTQGGALGIAHASWTFYGQEDNSTVLYGTQGILKLYTDPDYSVILEHADGQVEKFAVGKITTNEEQQAGIRSSTGVIDEFVAAVTEKRPSCLDVDQVIHAMRVVLKAAQ